MQRNTPQTPNNPRHAAERDATQALAGQPRAEEDEEGLEQPEQVPSFFTTREFQARGPDKGPPNGNERRASVASRTIVSGDGDDAAATDEAPTLQPRNAK